MRTLRLHPVTVSLAQAGLVSAPPLIVPKRAHRASRLRHGFGMVDAIVAIMIAAAAMVGGARYYYQYLGNQIARSSAQQMTNVSSAVAKYMQDNYGALLSAVAAGGGLYQLPIADLMPIYLSPDFTNKNPYGQQYIIAVRQPVAGVNKLDALIYTTGGEAFSNERGLAMSAMLGSSGGYIDSTSTLKTTYNAWTTNLASYGASPGPGHLVDALFFNATGALDADYLYRDAIPGRPDLNKMNTAVDMGGNNISNGGQVGAASLVVSGAASAGSLTVSGATTTGSLAVGSNATVGGNLTAGGQVKGSTVTNGNLIMTGSELAGSSGDTYVQSPGGSTLYLNPWNSGQVVVGGGGNPGNLQVVGNTTTNTLNTNSMTASGTVQGNIFYPSGTGAVGAGCSPSGAIAKDGTGQTLSCVSGIWKVIGIQYVTQMAACAGGHPSGTSWCEGACGPADPGAWTRYVCVGGTSLATSSGDNGEASCFPFGSQVLMADGTWREISTIKAGEWVMGAFGEPVRIERLHRPTLGRRAFLGFDDDSLFWSDEHTFWTRKAGRQWFWTGSWESWCHDVALDATEWPGLHDNSSIYTDAPEAVEFATLKGFERRSVKHIENVDPAMPLFLPLSENGVPIIINGYVVGSGANQRTCDYTKLDWEAGLKKVRRVLDEAERQAGSPVSAGLLARFQSSIQRFGSKLVSL